MAQPSDDSTEAAAKTVQEAWSDFTAAMRAMLPEEFWDHRRAAQRELLLAARTLIDAALEHMEDQEAPERKPAQKIDVE
jgi:hypothetical protein